MGQRPENDSDQAREERVGELSRTYAAAVLAGDEVAAELVIREAIDAGLSISEVDEEIIAPALWLVGELWERGEISVADEHVATEISIRVLALEREARRVARVRPGYLVMLATPAGELHAVALRMVANVLQDAGYEVMMVGADVPAAALASLAGRHEPDVVCLSATMPGSGDQVLVTMHEVQRSWAKASFVIGGRGLTSRIQPQPGIEVCQRISEVVGAVDALVQSARMN
ncbi:MAG TPA: cobalamin-dependent protein [Solirubrobacteraceae bacterium]|nr:cobalamin-dependent protein [Solirubrobacteraceae bacterium]